MQSERITWVMYLVGSLLVFGSWVDLVPTGLGWIGWLMALAGWAAGNTPRRTEPSLSNAEQIERLSLLHQRSVISDEEFQREKRRVLDGAQ